MIPSDLLPTFDNLGHPRVLVLGDLILDRYTFGNAERVSQEAPVILLRAEQREARLGGAANVCHMLRGLQAEVACAGVVGADADGELVRKLLADAGVDHAALLVDSTRPTTVKERFIGRAQGRHPHQMLRVDSELRHPIDCHLEARIAERLLATVADFDAVLVSDYDKGVCTPSLLREVIRAARAAGVPLLVDPIRAADYSRYRGATSMTPNRLEAELATGVKIVTADDAVRAGQKLRRELALDMGIVTLDRDGMALVHPDGRGEIFPTRPRAVYDITGAGDMALAMIGVALAAGVAPPLALQLANVAAGLEVEKVGVAVIPRAEIRERLLEIQGERRKEKAESQGTGASGGHQPPGEPEALAIATTSQEPAPHAALRTPFAKIVTLDDLVHLAASHRAAGRKLVFTNGCFDLLHVGHVSYLAEARAQGEVLVVGLNSDASVRRLKGPARPVIRQQDRAAMLASLAAVDYVVVFHEDTPHEVLRQLRPEVLVKGGTYAPCEVVGHEIVAAYGGRVAVCGLVEGVSTTNILDSLTRENPLRGPHFAPAPAAHGGEAEAA
ncbi:MAG TPA: D-glycero-beta-D-manno-heptose 1-phosphate adenylyltransferase [Pirellulales bacterium]|nr:D-glycero-beta-D-manno-heptose 1-phosphate adenylyltransferase [Pirellulales bacterium]